MENIKQRSLAQITGDQAVHMLHTLLPAEWVIREMVPDYGVDLMIEFFEKIAEGYRTTGEFVFVQVKGTRHLNINRSGQHIRFVIESSLLATVELMPEGIPVLLIVVDVEKSDAYFLCLNDYIDRHLKNKHPDYGKPKTVTIRIPVKNRITGTVNNALIWYAKRRIIWEDLKKAMISKDRREQIQLLDRLLENLCSLKHLLRVDECFPELGASLEGLEKLVDPLIAMCSDDGTIERELFLESICECLRFYEGNCRSV